jgi:hypothetical protein
VHGLTYVAAAILMGPVSYKAAPDLSREELVARAQKLFRSSVEKLHQPSESRRLAAEAAEDLHWAAEFRPRDPLGTPSPTHYLSLGNAEMLAGRLPRAIWAFHAGLKIDPNDSALRANLEYARSLVHYPSGGRGRPVPEHWPRGLHRPSRDELFVFTVSAWSVAWLAGGLWFLRRKTALLAVAVGLAVIAVATGLTCWTCEQEIRSGHPLLIVMVDQTSLHRGNGPSYPLHSDVPTLPGGLEARLLLTRGAWSQIELSTGELGWVPSSSVWAIP